MEWYKEGSRVVGYTEEGVEYRISKAGRKYVVRVWFTRDVPERKIGEADSLAGAKRLASRDNRKKMDRFFLATMRARRNPMDKTEMTLLTIGGLMIAAGLGFLIYEEVKPAAASSGGGGGGGGTNPTNPPVNPNNPPATNQYLLTGGKKYEIDITLPANTLPVVTKTLAQALASAGIPGATINVSNNKAAIIGTPPTTVDITSAVNTATATFPGLTVAVVPL